MQFSEQHVTNLKCIFKKYPEIEAVYLFGSQVTGKVHAESDVDLAIYASDASIKEKKLDILTALVEAGLDRVDLMFIEEDRDIVLAYEAIRQNRLIYSKSDFESGRLYSRIIRMYLDFLPYLAVQRKAYKQRVLHGTA